MLAAIETVKKKWIRYLLISCCAIIGVYLFFMVFLIMMVGNQPTGPTMFDYSFGFSKTDGKRISDTQVLIPVIVDANGVSVFTETELNEMVRSDLRDPYRNVYNISLVSTDKGPMISLIIHPDADLPDMHDISISLKTDRFHGSSFSPSAVLENRTSRGSTSLVLPVYISPDPETSSAHINLNFMVCGYDKAHPADCQGFSSGPGSSLTRRDNYYAVEVTEFGGLNTLRHTNPLLLPIEYMTKIGTQT